MKINENVKVPDLCKIQEIYRAAGELGVYSEPIASGHGLQPLHNSILRFVFAPLFFRARI